MLVCSASKMLPWNPHNATYMVRSWSAWSETALLLSFAGKIGCLHILQGMEGGLFCSNFASWSGLPFLYTKEVWSIFSIITLLLLIWHFISAVRHAAKWESNFDHRRPASDLKTAFTYQQLSEAVEVGHACLVYSQDYCMQSVEIWVAIARNGCCHECRKQKQTAKSFIQKHTEQENNKTYQVESR